MVRMQVDVAGALGASAHAFLRSSWKHMDTKQQLANGFYLPTGVQEGYLTNSRRIRSATVASDRRKCALRYSHWPRSRDFQCRIF